MRETRAGETWEEAAFGAVWIQAGVQPATLVVARVGAERIAVVVLAWGCTGSGATDQVIFL